jgi:transcriptional regulator with XRE-family HTH domain
MTPFGTMMRELRKDKGLILAETARAIGISPPYLSQLETGARQLRPEVVEKAIRYFGLGSADAAAMRHAARRSLPDNASIVTIELRCNSTPRDRELALSFALTFNWMSPELKRRLSELLDDVVPWELSAAS